MWNSGSGTEVCDDGDTNNNNDCLNSCVPATCGDGVLWSDQNGTEECDDADSDDNDDCLNSCEMASCGDGIVVVV